MGFPSMRSSGCGLTLGGPELELGVAGRTEFDKIFLAAIVKLDAGHRLRVAAIERLGESEDGGERADGPSLFRAELAEAGVRSSSAAICGGIARRAR